MFHRAWVLHGAGIHLMVFHGAWVLGTWVHLVVFHRAGVLHGAGIHLMVFHGAWVHLHATWVLRRGGLNGYAREYKKHHQPQYNTQSLRTHINSPFYMSIYELDRPLCR